MYKQFHYLALSRSQQRLKLFFCDNKIQPSQSISRQTEFFYIISQADNKAVDVKAGNPKAGSELIMYAKWPEPKDNQLWYQDTNGVIRSKMNDFALTAASKYSIRAYSNAVI